MLNQSPTPSKKFKFFDKVTPLFLCKVCTPYLGGLLLSACMSSSQPATPINVEANQAANSLQYDVISERRLEADGVEKGLTAYQLIRNFAGERSIEAPDLYSSNHPGEPHIFEGKDNVVGNHFVFVIHKDHDKDRDKTSITDRQRNEIKGYHGSSEELKAYKHQAFTYSWKFKVNDEMTFSRNFGHFFQLKAVDGGPGAPILTISSRDRGERSIEVIHRIHGKTDFLAKVPFEPIKGKWLQVNCFVDYRNQGKLVLQIKEVVSGKQVINLALDDIDMLRGESSGDFVRPKWGIYRSLKTKEMLRSDEEQVFFADFVVQRLQLKNVQ